MLTKKQIFFRQAKERNLKLVSYEFGQGLVETRAIEGNGETGGLTDLFINANRDDHVRNVYYELMKTAKTWGIEELMHYNSIGTPTEYGSWGLWEYQDQPDTSAYKYLGILDFNKEFYTNRSITVSEFKVTYNQTNTVTFTLASYPKNNVSLDVIVEGCSQCVIFDPPTLILNSESLEYFLNISGVALGNASLRFFVGLENGKAWGINTIQKSVLIEGMEAEIPSTPHETTHPPLTTSEVYPPPDDSKFLGMQQSVIIGSASAVGLAGIGFVACFAYFKQKKAKNLPERTNVVVETVSIPTETQENF